MKFLYNKSLIFLLLISFSLFGNCKKEEIEPSENVELNEEKKEMNSVKKIIFFGDSLTEGLGLSSIDQSYPMIILEKLKKDGYEYEVINAGVSGDTTSGGLNRLDWVISQDFSVFVLELGANDMMRGVNPKVVESNLKKIINKVKEKNKNAKVLLIPMKPFPNLGMVYGEKFEKIYDNVSKSENVPLSNFLLKNIAGIKKLNQKDGIHPTKEGHLIMADNIYSDVVNLLEK